MSLTARQFPLARAARRAFTLIEIMVVVVVLGILAALAVPALGGGNAEVQVVSTARNLANMMDYAYFSAMTTQRVHALIFNADQRTFQLLAEQPPFDEEGRPNPAGNELHAVSLPGDQSRTLPEEIVIGSGETYEEGLSQAAQGHMRLLFFPDGTAEFAALVVEHPSGIQRQVNLNGMTGIVTITNPADEAGTATDSGSGASESESGAGESGGGEY